MAITCWRRREGPIIGTDRALKAPKNMTGELLEHVAVVQVLNLQR